jgi:homoserine kinase
VLAGLSGAMAWQPEMMHDVLHEPPRFAAMTASGALVRALRAAGFGACLSGAGPSVLVIVPSGSGGARDRVRQLAGPGWTVRSLCWDRAGACVYPGTTLPLRE